MNTDHFKKKLEQELRQVENELKTTSVLDEETGEWEPKETDMDTMAPMADQNEAADKIEEYDENRAIGGELEVRYKEIKDGLARIEDGTYGHCEICGKEIEEERLEANPAALTCIAHTR